MTSGLRFAWDSDEAESNLKKHGVSFEQGPTIFADPSEIMLPDPDHSVEEDRYISIGKSSNGELMLACYTEHDDLIRLISVRKAAPTEIRTYRRHGDKNA